MLLYSPQFDFVKLYAIDAVNAQRQSFVSYKPNDSLFLQCKVGEGVDRLADIFKRVYVPLTTPTPTELNTLQDYLENDAVVRINFYNSSGTFQGEFLAETRVLIEDRIIVGVSDITTAFDLIGGYYTLRFDLPATLWAGCDSFEGGQEDLIKSDYINLEMLKTYCKTSLLAYKNFANSFDFVYGYNDGEDLLSYTNSVRIPIELRNPQYKITSENYRKSSGAYVRLSASSQKEYDLETQNLLDEVFHEALSVALLHDEFVIEAKYYFSNGEYEVEYTKERSMPTQRGKGKCKVVLSPYPTISPDF